MTDFINRILRWQGRAQEPGLSALLLLELLAIFVVRPLSELGVLSFRVSNVAVLLVLIAGCAVVSRHRFALAAILASILAGWVTIYLREVLPSVETVCANLAAILVFLAVLTSVVGHAVFAPGRVTFHRVQGAIVIYLHLALIFSVLYLMVALFEPNAFKPPINAVEHLGTAQSIYFSFVALTSTGYGDIVPVQPFARSLANLEGLVGQLFPATLIARLVTLEFQFKRKPDWFVLIEISLRGVSGGRWPAHYAAAASHSFPAFPDIEAKLPQPEQ
jgi:voltage-gated potassium channel Kch